MSTFEELAKGTSVAAKRVANFFTAIRATFSPIPITSIAPTSDSSDTTFPIQPTTAPSLTRSSKPLKRLGSSFSDLAPDVKKPKELNLIVVVHLLPTLPEYLRALQQIGTIKAIIFKGAPENDRPSHMNEMANWVKSHNVFGSDTVSSMTKDDLKNEENVIKLLLVAAGGSGGEIIIMDIGGYFAHCLSILSNPDKYKDKWKLLGIVEDTENGHQKYHRALENLGLSGVSNLIQPNIYSVARSRMKMTEDYNVGKSLVRAADSILRESLDFRLEDHRVIGVLGFGKIGSSIAMHLRQQCIGIVMVYDVNPELLLRANSYDFVICTKEQMLQQASFIFCATGNKALTYNDLMNIGTNIKRLIIASCTSADDELDVHDGLNRDNIRNDSPDPRSFSRYNFQRLNGESIQVILLCDGNAVNFYRRAILGESIRSVQAAMIVCALNLQQLAMKDGHAEYINTLTNEEEMTIARLWLQHFSELDVRLITNVSCAHMKFDKASIEETVGDLPVDENSTTLIKEQLGLVQSQNIDPIDFMASERKLIITAPRGFGKTAVLFSLIHNVRNYYDLIWWFDCIDSLNSTLLCLAQVFHVSSIELPLDELQKAVLEGVFSSSMVNNLLLIVDNIQEFDSENWCDVNANAAYSAENTKDINNQRQFKCHNFISTLHNVINNSTFRDQRRCHIVALYTDDIDNQPPLTEPTSPKSNESTNGWRYLTLKEIGIAQAEKWVVEKLSLRLEPNLKANREKLIGKILYLDVRRLAIRLTALFLTSQSIKENELTEIENAVNKQLSHEIPDVLPKLIKLSLKRLRDKNELFFRCVQVASLINAGSISCEVFHCLYDVLSDPENTGNDDGLLSDEWKSFWLDLLPRLKKYCILKQNLLALMIHTQVSQRYIPSDYVEVYSMPSTYAIALRTSLSEEESSPVWKYALQLINNGFNYDYYSADTFKKFQYKQNVVHYLDHTTALIKHTDDWSGSEPYASLLAVLLCRLGSYYLNERRMYADASRSYSKAKTLFNKILNLSQVVGKSEAELSRLSVSKWSATLMGQICEQLTHDPNVVKDEEFVSEIEETRVQLESIIINRDELEKDRSRKYQREAIIAVARIRVQNAQNQWLESAKKELEDIQNEEKMGARTRSLSLQVLGNIYSLQEDHTKAVDSFRQALSIRENILGSEHLDVARTKYYFAFCLVENIKTMSKTDPKNKSTEVKDKLIEARCLCETAFKIQKTQLSKNHRNLKECSDLRREIDQLSEDMKPRTSLE